MPYKSSDEKKTAQREWKRKRKEIIHDLKRRPCQDCGGSFHPVCMQFDHIAERGKKSNNISRMTSHKLDKVYEEMAKCDLVCANCHALRTYYRQQAGNA